MDVMEEQVNYTENNASMEWANDTLSKLIAVLDEDINSNKSLTRARMQSLFADVMNIEIEKLRESIKKEFYGSIYDKGISDVILTVCDYYRCQPEDVNRRSRKREHVEPRQLICWMIYKRFVPNRLTFEQIGELIGGYDHSTALHSVKVIDQRIQTETSFRNDIMKILNGFGYRCTFEDGELKWVLVG